MYDNITQASAFDRSARNGFRCVQYLNQELIPEGVFNVYRPRKDPDYYKMKPVSDAILEVYKRRFLYDKADFNAKIKRRDGSAKDWVLERITFDGAYGDDRMIVHLFLPKNINPPYQTVVYFPGTGVCHLNSSENIEHEVEFTNLDFILKNGRAVLFPVYYGTFERQLRGNAYTWKTNQEKLDAYVYIIKDFKRSIDYLETRDDIDMDNLAYYGFSWGGLTGPVLTVLEDRFKVSILSSGGIIAGFDGRIPELAAVNYLPRVKIPTLMLNGKYDLTCRYDDRAKPMFDLLGTKEKEMRVYDVDHHIPKNELIKEVLAWLDRYLGPVE
jgi:cephalosporin-C deacetylase-like acetyl esterase